MKIEKKMNQSTNQQPEIELEEINNENNPIENNENNEENINNNEIIQNEEENNHKQNKKQKRSISPLNPQFFKLKQKDDQHKRWYIQCIVFIISIICFVTNIFGVIIFADINHEIRWYSILVFGVIEGFLFLLYASIKFALRIDSVQRTLKQSNCIRKMISCCVQDYDDEKYILKIPNVEKIIEEYVSYQSDHHKEKNISPLKRLFDEYKKFSREHDTYLKILSGIFLAVSIFLSLIQMFLYNQALVPFNTQMTKVFTFTVIIIIDYTLLYLFIFKLISLIFFVLYELSYAIVYKRFQKEFFIFAIMFVVLISIFANRLQMEKYHTLLFEIAIVLSIVVITLVLYLFIKLILEIRLYIKEKQSLCSFLKSKLNQGLWCTSLIVITTIVFVIMAVIAWFGFFTRIYSDDNTVNTFDTINERRHFNLVSFCEKNTKISQLTFGIGDSSYLRQEYAKPSIITPTVDLSDLFDVSPSTQDYYRITSKTLPMNGIVFYPSTIKKINSTLNLVFILPNEMGNLIDSDMGYVYLQESLAENGIVSITLDQGFLDVDQNGHTLNPKDKTKSPNEIYLQARLILTIKTINYLYERLNVYFSNKLNFSNIGLIGDREGGGVAMRIINSLKQNKLEFMKNEKINNFTIESIFVLNCKDIPIPNPMVGMNSYFIETLPELSSYDPPLLSSYYMYNKTGRIDTLNLKYSGLLIVERGIGDYYNMKYNEAKSDILMDYIVQNETYLIKETELRCLVTNYATAHFLCSLNSNCTNIDLLKDFKRGKEIIPNQSGYVNTFESNREQLLYSNGTFSEMTVTTDKSTYQGNLYQNLYQTLHLLYVCGKDEKCQITFQLNKVINCCGIKFSFFKNTDSDEKVYDQYITVYEENGNTFNLPSFTYAKIIDIENKGQINEMYLLQTYIFNFPQSNVSITKFVLYFKGEILLDDIALIY